MRSLSSLVLLLLFSTSLYAVPPQLEIPNEVKPVDGYVTVLPKTDAVSVLYISLDGLSPFPSALLKDARYLVVPTKGEKSGRYRFVAVGASKEGEQVRVDFVVVVGNQPLPPEPPTPQPDGKLGLIKTSREGVLKVSTATAADRKKLASAQRSVASAVAAGGVIQPADILKVWRDGNNAAVNSVEWQKWGVDVSTSLQKLYADGKLKSKDDWSAAFEEIALGLEGN